VVGDMFQAKAKNSFGLGAFFLRLDPMYGEPHFKTPQLKDFGLDLSYLIPDHWSKVLSNTFRVSVNYCPFR
jgi:hypothetical protein